MSMINKTLHDLSTYERISGFHALVSLTVATSTKNDVTLDGYLGVTTS